MGGGDERVVVGAAPSLQNWINPNTILGYSESQYAERDAINRRVDGRHRVPAPWNPGMKIRWFPATEIGTGQRFLVPAACCFTRYRRLLTEDNICKEDTVGAASGAGSDQALTGALLELIERDATAIWWYNRTRHPTVRIESFHNADLTAIKNGLRLLQRSIDLLYVTNNIDIPCFVAVSANAMGGEIAFGAAAHPDLEVAAVLAATEVIQFFIEADAGISPADYPSWARSARLSDLPYLRPSHSIEASSIARAGSPATPLETCLEMLKRVSLQVLAVNLTRDDVQVPFFRAFVPGLCYLNNRLGQSRMLQVPVKMGWLEQPLAEEHLNPICCVF